MLRYMSVKNLPHPNRVRQFLRELADADAIGTVYTTERQLFSEEHRSDHVQIQASGLPVFQGNCYNECAV